MAKKKKTSTENTAPQEMEKALEKSSEQQSGSQEETVSGDAEAEDGEDEDIPEEEMDYCTLGTADYIFTGKYPPTKGKFFKDVIAGHVAASHVAKDPYFKGVYFDGYSHFYIDGTVNKNKRLLCLAYDEKDGQYYDFLEDGSFKLIRRK